MLSNHLHCTLKGGVIRLHCWIEDKSYVKTITVKLIRIITELLPFLNQLSWYFNGGEKLYEKETQK